MTFEESELIKAAIAFGEKSLAFDERRDRKPWFIRALLRVDPVTVRFQKAIEGYKTAYKKKS